MNRIIASSRKRARKLAVRSARTGPRARRPASPGVKTGCRVIGGAGALVGTVGEAYHGGANRLADPGLRGPCGILACRGVLGLLLVCRAVSRPPMSSRRPQLMNSDGAS